MPEQPRPTDGEQPPGNESSEQSRPSALGASDVVRAAALTTVTSILSLRNQRIDVEVKEALRRRKIEAEERHLPAFVSYLLPTLEREFSEVLARNGYDGLTLTLSQPPQKLQSENGVDTACNVAPFARSRGMDSAALACDVARILASHCMVAHAETAGPFVNIRFNYAVFAPALLGQIAEHKDRYGFYNEGNGTVVLIDYSSPNFAKNMTVAHLRSTIIGHALSKLYDAAGYTAFRVNHLGDWGTQFGKIVYQYRETLQKEGENFLERLRANMTGVLLEIYREFVKNEKEDDTLSKEASDIFLQLEKKDPELLELWEQFITCSIEEFSRIYRRLGVEFDALQGESFYEDRMSETLAEGLRQGVLQRREDGAVVFPGQSVYDPAKGKMNERMMQERDGTYRDEIIVKPSGGTVYLTRDLAAIRYRCQELGAQKVLYVIGKEQHPHCLKLFAMAEKLGYIQRGQAEHISFGHLTVDGVKMSGRHGEIALLDDVLNDSTQAALKLLQLKRDQAELPQAHPPEDMQTLAEHIGVSALIFNDLRQERIKDIAYSPDAARHVESGQCPYVQYSHCRLKAISEKADAPGSHERIPDQLSPLERSLLMHMGGFPNSVREAVKANAPHRIATYMTELCQLVNNFYASHPVGKAEGDVRDFRLSLVESCQQVLRNAAHLLHIALPDRM